MDKKLTKRPTRIVVKLGTNLLTGGADALDIATIGNIFAQIASVKSSGIEVLIVSSGAVAAGRVEPGTEASAKGPGPLPSSE